MAKRITCIPMGVHLGSKRFPDGRDRPEIKAWRCDLTALSHLYNLYFLACNDTIHIYQPSFPTQSIPDEPALILHPPVSSEGRYGIDPQTPHSITRIHLGYLGHEEILLATCDDGDVVGYRTREIQRALDHRTATKDATTEPIDENTIKTFLHRNVGASAWGLAIHREARMIAISANTHDLTVLAYALARPENDSKDSDDSDESMLSTSESASDFPWSREEDHVITLKATSNVPAVSFINNGDDPRGRWLFSSLINGETIIWDLHHPTEPTRGIHMRLGWCASARNPSAAPSGLDHGICQCWDHSSYPHGTWGAMMLDTQSAYERPAHEMSSAEKSILEPVTQPCLREITGCNEDFTVKLDGPLGSDAYESFSDDDDDSNAMMILGPEMEENAASSEDEEIEPLDSNTDSDAESDAATSTDKAGEGQEDDSNTQTSGVTSENIDMDSDSLFVPDPQSQFLDQQYSPPPGNIEDNPALVESFNQIVAEMGDYSDTTDEDEESSDTGAPAQLSIDYAQISYGNAMPIPTKKPYCEIGSEVDPLPLKPPSGPCLILTREEVCLVQQPFRDINLTPHDPVLCVRLPLHPEPGIILLDSHDRMCYFSQIPELGVFVVASPLGRAAVFSIYWTKVGRDPVPKYGVRLEYLLPFENRNDKEVYDVKGARLVGVAIGPVQGMFDIPENVEGEVVGEGLPQSRRWRLLMYYTDHTVLSFEISKRRASEWPTLDELVV